MIFVFPMVFAVNEAEKLGGATGIAGEKAADAMTAVAAYVVGAANSGATTGGTSLTGMTGQLEGAGATADTKKKDVARTSAVKNGSFSGQTNTKSH